MSSEFETDPVESLDAPGGSQVPEMGESGEKIPTPATDENVVERQEMALSPLLVLQVKKTL